MSYHRVVACGHLGRDPSLRFLPDGTAVADFSVATSERWKNKDGEPQERTVWWKITVWRRLAETCAKFLSTGSLVLVEGQVQPDSETGGPTIYTRNDGLPGANFEITASTVCFLGGGRSDSSGQPRDEDIPPEADMEADSIPF